MRPDWRSGRNGEPWWRPVARIGADPVALDHELQPLVSELEAAGARAQLAAGAQSVVDPGFGATLREHLLATLVAGGAAPGGVANDRPEADGRASRAEGHVTDPKRVAAVAPVIGDPVRMAARRGAAEHRSSARRWAVLAAAAALVVAVAGLDLSVRFPARPAARTADAVGAVLVRAGAERPLLAGASLEPGDVVRVGPGGHALVDLGGGQARLTDGAVVAFDRLDAPRIELSQLAGRVYHRVAVDPGGDYVVRTASLRWTALGTAFDLDYRRDGLTATVRELSLEHDVRIDGPGLAATIREGHGATVQLVGDTPDLETAALTAPDLVDPWLLANARRDLESGHAIGILTGLTALPSASPAIVPASPQATLSSAQPTMGPAAAAPSPTPAPTPTAKATAKATPKATPKATAKPSPTPTAAPTPGTLALSLTPCDGSFVVASWSKWLADGFHHYQGLRAGTATIPTSWPPPAGVAAPEGLHSTVATSNNGVDSGLAPGTTAWYRVVAYDGADGAVAASGVASAVIKPVKALGTLSVGTVGPSSTSFTWTPYGGGSTCFGYYKLVYSGTDSTPSYLDGDPYLWASSTKSDGSVVVDSIPSGDWCFRLQVLRDTPGGTQLVAETEVTSFTVP
jgi:ferric-dicitrate binding protein FerR (iron transport regulator)